MYTFSVVIPVYNAASTIERCVKSLVQSGGDDLQIVLIEDCSKDNSFDVCEKLACEYSSVLCLHNEINRGVSYTRNRGLEAAEGKYILVYDCLVDIANANNAEIYTNRTKIIVEIN